MNAKKIARAAVLLVLLSAGPAFTDDAPCFQILFSDGCTITEDDIESYDIETHTIHLCPDSPQRVFGGCTKNNPSNWFRVKANGVLVYTGSLVSMLSSSIPPGVTMMVPPYLKSSSFEEGRLWLAISYRGDESKDPRADSRVLEALKEARILE